MTEETLQLLVMGTHKAFRPKGYRKHKNVPRESKRRRSKETLAKFGTYARKKLHDTFRRKNKTHRISETLFTSQRKARGSNPKGSPADRVVSSKLEYLEAGKHQNLARQNFECGHATSPHRGCREHTTREHGRLIYENVGSKIIHLSDIFDDPLDDDDGRLDIEFDTIQQQMYMEYPLPDPDDKNGDKKGTNEIDRTKRRIRMIKEASLNCTRNALRLAQEAEATGLRTADLLGQQSNILKNIEEDLNIVGDHAYVNKYNMNKLYGLKTAKVVGNPFHPRRKSRGSHSDQKVGRGGAELLDSDITDFGNRVEPNNYYLTEERRKAGEKTLLRHIAKYQFESDHVDNKIELEMHRNLDAIEKFSGRLHKMASSAAEEIEGQREQLRQISADMGRAAIKLNHNTKELEKFGERSGSSFGRFSQIYL